MSMLLKISANAALLITVVVLIRAIAIHKLPKRTFTALWGVVLCTLLVPVRFASPIHYQTLLGKINLPAATVAPALVEHGPPLPGAGALAHSAGTAVASATPLLPAGAPLDWMAILTWGWALGALACLLFFVLTHLRCRKEYHTALPVENAFVSAWQQTHPLRRPVRIVQFDKIDAPFTYGLWKPVIMLPKVAQHQTHTQLEYVLMHEWMHIRRFDILAKWLLILALAVHWFNPLVWVMYVLANRDIELACDEAVILACGDSAKSTYALTLIAMAEKKARLAPISNSFAKNAIEERIVAVMKTKKSSLRGIVIALLLISVTTSVFASSAESAATVSNTNTNNTSPVYAQGESVTQRSAPQTQSVNPTAAIEWWTYDEYQTWLAQEKLNLQSVLGEKAWNQSDGWYIWTQERIDEAIALYEQELAFIKDGGQISKPIGGENGAILAASINDWAQTNAMAAQSLLESIQPYQAFGVSVNNQGYMEYQGLPVREIVDPVLGALITRSLGSGFENGVTPDNAIDLTALYQNGAIAGLRKSTPQEFAQRTQERLAATTVTTEAGQSIVEDASASQAASAVADEIYVTTAGSASFGTAESTASEAASVAEDIVISKATTATASDSADAVAGTLSSTVFDSTSGEVTTTEGGDPAEWAEMFEKYVQYGLTYDSATGDLHYQGALVRYFEDSLKVGPYTYAHYLQSSNPEGTLDVLTVFDADGNMTGLRVCTEQEFAARTADLFSE